jgi:hypothetical protein
MKWVARAFAVECWGVNGHEVIIQFKTGRMLFRVLGGLVLVIVGMNQGVRIRGYQMTEDGVCLDFHVEKGKLKPLSDYLKKRQDKMVSFSSIVAGDHLPGADS